MGGFAMYLSWFIENFKFLYSWLRHSYRNFPVPKLPNDIIGPIPSFFHQFRHLQTIPTFYKLWIDLWIWLTGASAPSNGCIEIRQKFLFVRRDAHFSCSCVDLTYMLVENTFKLFWLQNFKSAPWAENSQISYDTNICQHMKCIYFFICSSMNYVNYGYLLFINI